MRRVVARMFVCVSLCVPAMAARANSSSAQGLGALSASASIDFKIVIPPVLALSVGAAATNTSSIRFDPATPQVRVARSGLTLGLPQLGAAGAVNLRSNMRQVTVIQDNGPRATLTVATP